jgi:hypothetical protein
MGETTESANKRRFTKGVDYLLNNGNLTVDNDQDRLLHRLFFNDPQGDVINQEAR